MGLKLKYFLIMCALVFVGWASLAIIFNEVPDDWAEQSGRDAGFVLDQLRVQGADRTTKKEILSALDVEDGIPLMSIDLIKLRERMEALSWVKQAIVARRLPNELSIKIEERLPFALWQLNGNVALIDADGVVITRHGLEEFSDHLLMVGDGVPEAANDLVYLLSLAPKVGGRIRSAIRISNRRWDLIFDNGIRLKLPAIGENYNPSMAWAQFVLQEEKHRLLDREVSVIDLRLRDRMVMRVLPDGLKNLKNYKKEKGV